MAYDGRTWSQIVRTMGGGRTPCYSYAPYNVVRRLRRNRERQARHTQLPLFPNWPTRWPGIGRQKPGQPQRLQRPADDSPRLW